MAHTLPADPPPAVIDRVRDKNMQPECFFFFLLLSLSIIINHEMFICESCSRSVFLSLAERLLMLLRMLERGNVDLFSCKRIKIFFSQRRVLSELPQKVSVFQEKNVYVLKFRCLGRCSSKPFCVLIILRDCIPPPGGDLNVLASLLRRSDVIETVSGCRNAAENANISSKNLSDVQRI